MQGNKKLNEKRIHPTQKPLLVYQFLFQMFCRKKDKVLDTHLGSQNSRIMAHKLQLDFWGTEKESDYFKEGCSRFQRAILKPPFFRNKPVKQLQLF